MKRPEVVYKGVRLRVGPCTLGHDDSIGEWDRAFCVDEEMWMNTCMGGES